MCLKTKSRILRMLVCAAAGALCLYSGAACAATLYKAHGQPYLLAGTERFDFMGYYMVAAMWGAACVLSAVFLVLFIRRRKIGT